MFALVLLILHVWFIVAFGPAAYSNDLRVSVVYQRLVLGLNSDVVASINNISSRSVERYVERYRDHRSILPNNELFGETRGRNASITSYDLAILVEIVLDDPTLYLDEIQRELWIRAGTNASIGVISRWLDRIGITRQRVFIV